MQSDPTIPTAPQSSTAPTQPANLTPAGLPEDTSIPLSAVGRNKEGSPILLPTQDAETIATEQISQSAGEQISATPEQPGSSAATLEAERARELEPAIEAVQEQIARQQIPQANETVIAADTLPAVAPKTVSQPVVVLPLEQEGMNAARRKPPTESVRWLYEFCVRQIRKFQDILVVYREK